MLLVGAERHEGTGEIGQRGERVGLVRVAEDLCGLAGDCRWEESFAGGRLAAPGPEVVRGAADRRPNPTCRVGGHQLISESGPDPAVGSVARYGRSSVSTPAAAAVGVQVVGVDDPRAGRGRALDHALHQPWKEAGQRSYGADAAW